MTTAPLIHGTHQIAAGNTLHCGVCVAPQTPVKRAPVWPRLSNPCTGTAR